MFPRRLRWCTRQWKENQSQKVRDHFANEKLIREGGTPSRTTPADADLLRKNVAAAFALPTGGAVGKGTTRMATAAAQRLADHHRKLRVYLRDLSAVGHCSRHCRGLGGLHAIDCVYGSWRARGHTNTLVELMVTG